MMRVRIRSSHVVPSRHGVHLPQLSRAKNRTMRQQAFTMSVVSSMITMAPEPSMDPARSTVGLSSGRSICSSVNQGADAPPGMNALSRRPGSSPLQYSGASISWRNVVVPCTTSKTPGRFTCPETANMRMPGEASDPMAL